MKNYIFRTTATMKEYNRCKWWIDSDIVTEKRISAETVADALEIWREQNIKQVIKPSQAPALIPRH